MTTYEKLLKSDREVPKCINNVPQVGASAVLVMKQEPPKLVTPAQMAAQNQQLSAVVQRSFCIWWYSSG